MALLLLGLAAATAGPILLWLGWRQGRAVGPWRSLRGWVPLLVGLALLAGLAGAWGLAVGSIAAMLAALILLSGIALASTPDRIRPLRDPAPVHEPWIGWRDLGRRMAIFLIVVPGAFLVSGLVALALQAVARQAGWLEADSSAFGLLAFPLVWTVFVIVLLLRSGPAAMAIRLVAAAALSGVTLWFLA